MKERVTIPSHPATNEEGSENLKQLKGLRMLLAEDNPISVAVARKILHRWGIEVVIAVNGREAVDKFEPAKFDVILLDLEMPELDGISALKEIRKHELQVPILAFTASVYENIQDDLKGKGFNDYINKPFLPEDLYNKLNALVVAKK